ncbi:Trypsin inhibitor [Gryllus bimaculatus]|nr:Trypsin inhibitor [Gryllus bimaculatus]
MWKPEEAGAARGAEAASRSRPGGCLVPGARGICRAAFPRYAFNATSGSCQLFTWGGCQRQFNNFSTKEACERICNPPAREDPSPVSEDIGLFF